MILSVLNILSSLLFTASDVTADLGLNFDLASVPCTFSRWFDFEKRIFYLCSINSETVHPTLDQKNRWFVTLEGQITVFVYYVASHVSFLVKLCQVYERVPCSTMCVAGGLWLWVGEIITVMTMSWFVTGMTQTTASVTEATAATPGGSVTRLWSARGWQNARTDHATAEVRRQRFVIRFC